MKKALGLRSEPLTIETVGRDSRIRIGGVAGILELDGLRLQIVPRFIARETHADSWQTSVLTMLNRSRRKQYIQTRVRDVGLNHLSFIDI